MIFRLEETAPRPAKRRCLCFWENKARHSTMLYDLALTKGRRRYLPGEGSALLRAHGA